ncbi:MAG TPA: hypothetical protein VF070_36930 [Streptosporangiaceae bacterium]
MTSTELQGWYEDPFRLHEARYFSTGRPTKLVRDGDVESYDEPPGEGVPGSGATASWGQAVSATLNRAEGNEANDPNPVGGDVPAYARRRLRVGVLTAVAVVAIAGAVTAAVIVGKPRPATVPVTAAMVYTATMNASSADVYAIYAFTTSSHKIDIAITQSGPVSWSANQGETAMKMTAGGRQLWTTQQIIDGRKTYSKISIKGLPASALASLPGVAGWSEETWTGASSSDLPGILSNIGGLSNPAGIASPASLLGLLRAQASSVQNLGAEVLDGINTTHYRALIPLSHLVVGTPAEFQQAERVFGTNFIGVDYWIDSSDLLRQLRLVITALRQPSATTSSPGEVTMPLGTFPVTFSVSLRLSNYGTPVHVVPPPPAQITSRGTCVSSDDGFNCTS